MPKKGTEDVRFVYLIASTAPLSLIFTVALYFYGDLSLTIFELWLTTFSLIWYVVILIFYLEQGVNTAYTRLSHLYDLLNINEKEIQNIKQSIHAAIRSQKLLIQKYTTTRRYTIWVPFLCYIALYFLFLAAAAWPPARLYGGGVWLSLMLVSYVPVLLIFYSGMKLRPYAAYEKVRAELVKIYETTGKNHIKFL